MYQPTSDALSTLIINGKTSRTKSNRDLLINKHDRFEPPIINGFIPTDIVINGLNRPPVLSGCVLNLPLWHPYLSVAPGGSFDSLDANVHTCTVTGTIWTPQGRTFDGDDYIDIPAHASLNFTDKGTWLAWVKMTGTPAGWVRIFSKGYAETYLAFNASLNPLARIHGLGGGIGQYAFTSNLILNTPALVGFTYDKDGGANNFKMYLDGVLDRQVTETGTIGGTSAWCIGANSAHGELFASGIIAEFFVYGNIALTQQQISGIYNAMKWRYR